MTCGKRIRQIRQEMNMTQQELADKLYISKASVSLSENDKIDIKESRLEDIARILGVNVVYLFGESRQIIDENDRKYEWMELYDELLYAGMLSVAIDQTKILTNMKKLT